MSEIIVGFSRPKAWFEPFSWLIRLVTWSPYSHVYIKFYSETYQRWLVYQASGLKVNFIGQPMFNSEEVIFEEFEVAVSDGVKLKTVQFAVDECGSPYGMMQILGFSWVLFMRLLGRKVKNPFYGNSSFFCSELVGEILEEIVEVADNMDPATSTPKDVYNFMVSKGYRPVN